MSELDVLIEKVVRDVLSKEGCVTMEELYNEVNKITIKSLRKPRSLQ